MTAMLENVGLADELRSLARSRRGDEETRTVRPKDVEAAVEEGWRVQRKLKKSVRLSRMKPHHVLLEDKVWTLLYRMGFGHLSGRGGATIRLDAKDPASAPTQIDVVAVDSEVAIAVECKSAAAFAKRPTFQADLGKFALIRERFATYVNDQFRADSKHQVVLAMFLSNIQLTDNDRARAEAAGIQLFDDRDLKYYADLVAHLGPAARYQLLADMLPSKTVPGLELRIPAIRTKMGGTYCFTFSISPEYLLKIAYVSHRAKGKPSDVNAYQRMLRKQKLDRIREYIDGDGIFPTNIVVNLDQRKVDFQRVAQKGDKRSDTDRGLLGWLTLRPAYKSAWVIDGQHRLYAYSGGEKAGRSLLSVLAFAGLPASKQAELFIDINSKQTSVKRSLLEELYAELHWDAADLQDRLRAVISKAIQELDADQDSSFHQRIQKADERKDPKRCITIDSIFRELEKAELFIANARSGHAVVYGPLWAGDDAQKILERTVHVLRAWFGAIANEARDWWDKGAEDGGGLAMNDGVVSCLKVLRSVLSHLDSGKQRLVVLSKEDLAECLAPYASAVGRYLGGLPEEERRRHRAFRGVEGQTRRMRMCQLALRDVLPEFSPPGLDQWVREERAGTNDAAKGIIDHMELEIQKVIIEELKREYGSSDSAWWTMGVPRPIRQEASKRFEDDDRSRGAVEHYLNLLEYKKVVLQPQNWRFLGPLFAYGRIGNKEKRVDWLDFVNRQRNIVAHASAGRSVSLQDLERLREYETWLTGQLSGTRDEVTAPEYDEIPSQVSE